MNILVFFIAGVSVGWAADKLYHSFVGNSDLDEEIIGKEEASPKKAMSKIKDVAGAADEKNASGDVIEGRDDLSQLKGVGPKLAEALDKIGIYNYEQLSNSPVDELLVRLKKTGGRFTEAATSSIVERARLAVVK